MPWGSKKTAHMARGEGPLVTLSTCPRPCPRGPGPRALRTMCASRGPALCIVRCLPKQPLCVATRCLILLLRSCVISLQNLRMLRILVALELIVSDGLAGPLRSCCLWSSSLLLNCNFVAPAIASELNRSLGCFDARCGSATSVVFRLPKAFADGADAGTGMVLAVQGFGAGGCSALAKTMEMFQRLHKCLNPLWQRPQLIRLDLHQNHGIGYGK